MKRATAGWRRGAGVADKSVGGSLRTHFDSLISPAVLASSMAVGALSFSCHGAKLYQVSHTLVSLSEPIVSTTDQAPHAPTTRESRHDANRRAALAVLADAHVDEIEQGLRAVAEPVDYVELRGAETGLVMLRGRIGGDGAPFNVGEATVTRAAVQIPSGEVGFAYILGRDQTKARLCAVCDALWQSKRYRDAVERRVLAPIRARLEAERACQRAQTAATRVDFLTLVRGED